MLKILLDFFSDEGISVSLTNVKISDRRYRLITLAKEGLAVLHSEKWDNKGIHYFLCLKYYFYSSGLKLIVLSPQMLEKGEIVLSKLRSLLGLSQRIYARQTCVKAISGEAAKNFAEENDLLPNYKAKYRLGLFWQEKLVMVALFASARIFTKGGKKHASYELIKLVGIKDTTIVGGTTKLLMNFIKLYRPDDIMTYVDLNWYTGNRWGPLQFEFQGLTSVKRRRHGSVPISDRLNIGSLKLKLYL